MASAGSTSAVWKFAVVDPDSVPEMSPDTPQDTVQVNVLGSTRASLTEAFTATDQTATQTTPDRVFHKSELVAVRLVSGELVVSKLYLVTSLFSLIEAGDVWLRGCDVLDQPVPRRPRWFDEAVDLVDAHDTFGVVSALTNYRTLNGTGNGHYVLSFGTVPVSDGSGATKQRDLFWPFLAQSGQAVSTLVGALNWDADPVISGSFAYPPDASTGDWRQHT